MHSFQTTGCLLAADYLVVSLKVRQNVGYDVVVVVVVVVVVEIVLVAFVSLFSFALFSFVKFVVIPAEVLT